MSFRIGAALVGAVLAMGITPVAEAKHAHKAHKHDQKGKHDHKGNKEGEKTSKELRKAISAQGMFKHAQALQMIADENGGNRASGFQGYGASVQYVLTKLRDAGYKPTTQVFDFVTFEETAPGTLMLVNPETRNIEFITMSYSASGDTGEKAITAVDLKLSPDPNQRVSTSGCEAADFANFPAGNIALMQRGSCPFALKVTNAQTAGAAGAIIFNSGTPGNEGIIAGTLGETAQDGQPDPPDVKIPAVGISYGEGDRLAGLSGATAQIIVNAKSDQRKSTNILADTRSGDPNNVTIVGSHLDSVTEGPGINDNGSGSAFNLELALQMAERKVRTENRVRFAFWGAEESGLVGATRYVQAISDEEFAKIAANLNFDMLASPNHGKFVYDGDFSHTPPPATAPNVNPGAAYIESVFLNYFKSVGISPDPTAFDGRSDYKPFQDNGIAAGGLFSGAEVAKSEAQALKWGGTAGLAFDPNYHQAGDNITNLDLKGWEQLADAGAHVLAMLAEDDDLRDTLAGGAKASAKKSAKKAKARKAARRAKAPKGALGEYLGDRLYR
ncbi:MAG TPA: M28 family peptidase [Solirubrobacter sp.]|nr:M28 family peptidase [Solirubrobacter sp.]